MKILILSHFEPYPPDHGAALRIWYIARSLKDKGNEVGIICNNIDWKNKYLRDKIDGINIIQVPFLFSFMRKKHFLFQLNPLMFLEFIKNIRKTDIIQFEFPYFWIYGLFGRLLGKKIIYDSHGLETELQKDIYGRKGLVLSLIKFMEFMAVKVANKIISCSEEDSKKLVDKYNLNKKKVITIETGMRISEFSKVEPYEFSRFTITYVGSNKGYSGQDTMKLIVKDIIPKVIGKKDVDFCFIGAEIERGLLKDNIILTEPVTEKEFIAYLKGSDLCISPEIKGVGIRTKIISYMAAKKCIISTPEGCKGVKIKKDDEIIVTDINDFSDKIIELIDNDKKRDYIGKNAFELAKRDYDFDNLIERYPYLG